jgi:hypothetical protein
VPLGPGYHALLLQAEHSHQVILTPGRNVLPVLAPAAAQWVAIVALPIVAVPPLFRNFLAIFQLAKKSAQPKDPLVPLHHVSDGHTDAVPLDTNY